MKVTYYSKDGRSYEKKEYDSGKIIIKDVTPSITGTRRVTQYELVLLNRDLLLKIAEKLGVPTDV